MDELAAIDSHIDLAVLASKVGTDLPLQIELLLLSVKGLRALVEQQHHRIRELEEHAHFVRPDGARMHG